MQRLSILATAALFVANFLVVEAQETPGVLCYNNAGTTQNYGSNIYQTQGQCTSQCKDAGKAVWATTKGNLCYCGDAYPSTGEVDYTSNCNIKCLAWNQKCGGAKAWTFGTTGVSAAADGSDPLASVNSSTEVSSTPSSTSSDSATTPSTTATAVVPPRTTVTSGQTIVITATGKTTSIAAATQDAQLSGKASQGGGTSKAGLAAGIVVGLIVAFALGLSLWLLYRRKRRLDQEEEYKNALSTKEFVATARKPVSDHRLDPVMLQRRRLSDGSIADNQDFSRRILKVANPDEGN